MTIPTHSVKHVRNRYRKFQFLAAFFATLTIAAAFLAAVSGVQITRLQKQQASTTEQPIPSDSRVENDLIQQIESLNAQLANEKTAAQSLRKKITSLERRLTATKKAVKPQPVPKPNPAQITPEPTPESRTPNSAVPEPKPKTAPTATPKPGPEPEPVVKPAPTPVPAPSPKPTIQPEVAPTPKPEPAPVPKPQPETAPPAPKPDPAIRPVPVPVPAPSSPEEPSQQDVIAPTTPAPEASPAVPPQSTATGRTTPSRVSRTFARKYTLSGSHHTRTSFSSITYSPYKMTLSHAMGLKCSIN